MFCVQREQTARADSGAGCATAKGVCGKDEATADLQDVLIFQLKGIGQYATRLRALGQPDAAADSFILYALFTTLTNELGQCLRGCKSGSAGQYLGRLARGPCGPLVSSAKTIANCRGFRNEVDETRTIEIEMAQAVIASVRAGLDVAGADVIGLRNLVLIGLKGVAAYAHHAEVLGETRLEISAAVAHTLDFLATDPVDVEALLEEALALGRINFTVMATLDAANTGGYALTDYGADHADRRQGYPRFGHDLRDLESILEATKDTGINIYTHGEMLPAHSYPKCALILTWWAITAAPGKSSKRNLARFRVQS